ncbi:MAG: hypothetical protein KBT06_03545 [Prevotellaceae bacterium]|nr:hypothetical protein [Candidatus Colivivens equi]
MKTIRTYSELMKLTTFEERFAYLKLNNGVGQDTFGFDRYLNQNFYRSKEWKAIRNRIIVRDNGCDLGIEDCPIFSKVIIHHMNPIRVEDILDVTEYLCNPEYLICVSQQTHNAIHYGNEEIIQANKIVEREANDTCLWRR